MRHRKKPKESWIQRAKRGGYYFYELPPLEIKKDEK
jgi:hypothetical protein